VSASSSSGSGSATTSSMASVETAGSISDSEAGNNLNQLNLAILGMSGMVVYG
jgi:hypothetical protein